MSVATRTGNTTMEQTMGIITVSGGTGSKGRKTLITVSVKPNDRFLSQFLEVLETQQEEKLSSQSLETPKRDTLSQFSYRLFNLEIKCIK